MLGIEPGALCMLGKSFKMVHKIWKGLCSDLIIFFLNNEHVYLFKRCDFFLKKGTHNSQENSEESIDTSYT